MFQGKNHSIGVYAKSGQSPDNRSSVILQPLSLHPIPRQYLFHFRPEPRGVVKFLAMAELMYYHIVADVFRAEHQKAVEVQVALAGTRAPAALLGPDGDVSVKEHVMSRKECLEVLGLPESADDNAVKQRYGALS